MRRRPREPLENSAAADGRSPPSAVRKLAWAATDAAVVYAFRALATAVGLVTTVLLVRALGDYGRDEHAGCHVLAGA
jgi:hypothetical protein